MYAQEDIDACTNSSNPDTMSLSLAELVAARNTDHRAETRTYRGSVDSRMKTTLANGRPPVMVELGSHINLVGEHTMNNEFRPVTKQCRLDIVKFQRPNGLKVHGVGAGVAPCDDVADIPMAVQCNNHV